MPIEDKRQTAGQSEAYEPFVLQGRRVARQSDPTWPIVAFVLLGALGFGIWFIADGLGIEIWTMGQFIGFGQTDPNGLRQASSASDDEISDAIHNARKPEDQTFVQANAQGEVPSRSTAVAPASGGRQDTRAIRDQLDALEDASEAIRALLDDHEARTLRNNELALAVRQNRFRLTLDATSNTMLELVFVPASKDEPFKMGRTDDERRQANAMTNAISHDCSYPQHDVCITDGFFIGKYEVTNGQYSCFLKDRRASPEAQAADHERDLPVVEVSWRDARDFCRWLSDRSGYAVRLPTEVEWEYAARGLGSDTFAQARSTYRIVKVGEEFQAFPDFQNRDPGGGPCSVKENGLPSWCGAYHMSGNVQEWCVDVFEEDAYRRVAAHENATYTPLVDPVDWVTADAGSRRRVFRGGAFADSTMVSCEAATRRWKTEETKTDCLGFRVVVLFPDWFGKPEVESREAGHE